MFLGSIIIGESPGMSLLYNTLNLVEVLIGALLLKRKSTVLPTFTDGRYLLRFIGFACVLGPAIAGVPFAIFMHLTRHEDFLSVLLGWAVGDGLGIAVVTPPSSPFCKAACEIPICFASAGSIPSWLSRLPSSSSARVRFRCCFSSFPF
jgi:hypothetical protein